MLCHMYHKCKCKSRVFLIKLLSLSRLFVEKEKYKSQFHGQGTGRQCLSMRKKTVMRMMVTSTTVVVVAKVPTEVRVEAQALAGDMNVSVATAGGGITVPHGRGASHHALIADLKPLLLHPGLPRSPLWSLAKMKVEMHRLSIRKQN